MKIKTDQGEHDLNFTREQFLGNLSKNEVIFSQEGEDLFEGLFVLKDGNDQGFKLMLQEIIKCWDLDPRIQIYDESLKALKIKKLPDAPAHRYKSVYTFLNKPLNSILIFEKIITYDMPQTQDYFIGIDSLVSYNAQGKQEYDVLLEELAEYQLRDASVYKILDSRPKTTQFFMQHLQTPNQIFHWSQIPGFTSDLAIYTNINAQQIFRNSKSSIGVLRELKEKHIKEDKLESSFSMKVSEIKDGVPILPNL